MNDIQINLQNGYILLQDHKKEKKTDSGLYLPDESFNRFSVVRKVFDGSVLKEGDIVIKPIGRSTPIKIGDEMFDCIKEEFIFARVIED